MTEKEINIYNNALNDIEQEIFRLCKEETNCMNNDEYEEQYIEHLNQIEMGNKIRKEIYKLRKQKEQEK